MVYLEQRTPFAVSAESTKAKQLNTGKSGTFKRLESFSLINTGATTEGREVVAKVISYLLPLREPKKSPGAASENYQNIAPPSTPSTYFRKETEIEITEVRMRISKPVSWFLEARAGEGSDRWSCTFP